MTKILFLNVTTHGHVNPSLGLVEELVSRGVEVTYFSSEEFRGKIEATGATYREYHYDLNLFRNGFDVLLTHGSDIMTDILDQIKGETYDAVVHSIAMPFSKQIAEFLNVPAISMLAVFMGMQNFKQPGKTGINAKFAKMNAAYLPTAKAIEQKFGVTMPKNFFDLIMNEEPLNLVFTSKYFLPAEERSNFDEHYVLVGAAAYDRLEDVADFPLGKLENAKKVLYVSFGTIFGDFANDLYQKVFTAFENTDYLVVMAAHHVGLEGVTIPKNFIVRDFIPQNAVLRYTDVAITHNGLNSMNDLILNEVPFVSLPMGSDQPALAKQVANLGAGITLDYQTVTRAELKDAVELVQTPSYIENSRKIKQSFVEAGGYVKAVDAILGAITTTVTK